MNARDWGCVGLALARLVAEIWKDRKKSPREYRAAAEERIMLAAAELHRLRTHRK